MDLSKIKTLIDFVGRSSITELTVTDKDVTVRIFQTPKEPVYAAVERVPTAADGEIRTVPVKAPVFGVLHRSPAPGQPPLVKLGDQVEEGQTLFIIEAMKVFNSIPAPRAGRIIQLTDIDGGEVETGDVLAEIA